MAASSSFVQECVERAGAEAEFKWHVVEAFTDVKLLLNIDSGLRELHPSKLPLFTNADIKKLPQDPTICTYPRVNPYHEDSIPKAHSWKKLLCEYTFLNKLLVPGMVIAGGSSAAILDVISMCFSHSKALNR